MRCLARLLASTWALGPFLPFCSGTSFHQSSLLSPASSISSLHWIFPVNVHTSVTSLTFIKETLLNHFSLQPLPHFFTSLRTLQKVCICLLGLVFLLLELIPIRFSPLPRHHSPKLLLLRPLTILTLLSVHFLGLPTASAPADHLLFEALSSPGQHSPGFSPVSLPVSSLLPLLASLHFPKF